MKEHFSYEYGYILIDEECFYLTNTGNWSEARMLKEKGEFKTGNSLLHRVWIAGFVIIAGLGVAIFELAAHHSQSGIYIGVLLAGAGIWKVYTYMRKELGSTLYIKKQNISSEFYTNDTLNIVFTNAEGREEQISLSGISASDHEKIKTCLNL
ncbi:MAG TPA: hypothetical protein VNY73_06480 [Bacteroidia bacterium]|jgi:hypothetical protein|nr:hypothetical protein [Bacteroidia bacterium]